MNEAEEHAQDYLSRCDFRADDRANAEVGVPYEKHGDGKLSRLVSFHLRETFGGRWYDESNRVYFSKPLFDDWEAVYRAEVYAQALAYYESYLEGLRAFVKKYAYSA